MSRMPKWVTSLAALDRTVRGETTSTYLSHAAIDNEVLAIHEAAFITGEEEDSVGLFDSLAKASSWKVDLAAMAFCCVVA